MKVNLLAYLLLWGGLFVLSEVANGIVWMIVTCRPDDDK